MPTQDALSPLEDSARECGCDSTRPSRRLFHDHYARLSHPFPPHDPIHVDLPPPAPPPLVDEQLNNARPLQRDRQRRYRARQAASPTSLGDLSLLRITARTMPSSPSFAPRTPTRQTMPTFGPLGYRQRSPSSLPGPLSPEQNVNTDAFKPHPRRRCSKNKTFSPVLLITKGSTGVKGSERDN